MKRLPYLIAIILSIEVCTAKDDSVSVYFDWCLIKDRLFLERIDSLLNLSDTTGYWEFDPGVSQALMRARRYYRVDVETEPDTLTLYDGKNHTVTITHFNEPTTDAKNAVRYKDRVYYFTKGADFLEYYDIGGWQFYPHGDTLPTQVWHLEFRCPAEKVISR